MRTWLWLAVLALAVLALALAGWAAQAVRAVARPGRNGAAGHPTMERSTRWRVQAT